MANGTRAHVPMLSHTEPWTSGDILDCCDDCESCFLVSILPCIAFSENRRMLHGGELQDTVDPCIIYCLLAYLTSGMGCCLYAYGTRTDIRNKYNLKEDPCNDCCVHLLCHPCAMCQEYRELKSRPLTQWPMPDNTVPATAAPAMVAPAYGTPYGATYQQPYPQGGFYESGYVQIQGPALAPQPLAHEPPTTAFSYGGQPQYVPQGQPHFPPQGQLMMVPLANPEQPTPQEQNAPSYYSQDWNK